MDSRSTACLFAPLRRRLSFSVCPNFRLITVALFVTHFAHTGLCLLDTHPSPQNSQTNQYSSICSADFSWCLEKANKVQETHTATPRLSPRHLATHSTHNPHRTAAAPIQSNPKAPSQRISSSPDPPGLNFPQTNMLTTPEPPIQTLWPTLSIFALILTIFLIIHIIITAIATTNPAHTFTARKTAVLFCVALAPVAVYGAIPTVCVMAPRVVGEVVLVWGVCGVLLGKWRRVFGRG
ncbi:hypothetical protein BKA81DRAFT_374839 [Phyllosticta paracitricarpa]|uniref:Uncharacterized protein n=2 Tax=Phyllosticta TaxID=121621 RepID=A0ABR1MK36_9PEZI